ncbi:MAG: ABC transporter ATP-binding protein [Candidatus Thermoplasmatota archaeon]|jgi:ABC-2 type transport system ATP-binding protein|nr:ABC transporter ATP-binding protein [Candidatus Thermoplasmatota archaeon]
MVILKVNNLTKKFESDKKALDGLNLEIKANRLCFLGQNGSGKTTILSIMAGLISPSVGSLTINGIEPYINREESIKTTTFLFEKPKLTYRMKVKEFVNFVRATPDLSQDFDYMLDRLNLKEFYNMKLFELSSGQEQLVTLLGAFSRDSYRLIADEPFTHIDIFRAGHIINDMQHMGRDLVFSTHSPDEAEALADYIVILNDGKLVWHGSISGLFESDIFEVFLNREMDINMEYLFRYGDIGLVRSDAKILSSLLEHGKIIGFKKSGVRRIYGQFKIDH